MRCGLRKPRYGQCLTMKLPECILSFALECAGRIDEAIVECRHAISLNPSYPSAHGDIAELFALRGQVSEALREANEAIRLGTHDVIDFWRHHSMVVALFAGGNDRRALEVARKVVRTKPGFVRGALYWAAAAAATGNERRSVPGHPSLPVTTSASQSGQCLPWLCAALCEG